MRINTNINSMRTQEYMRQNQAKMSNAMDRLSSGKRINNASDDAAGLAIATRMRARENGLGVAANNTQDGMSLIRTADSAMNSVSNILLRMRDLANQSANGTNTDKNQAALNKEFSALKEQIDYISTNTEFNDKKLLDGSNRTIAIQTLDNADTNKQMNIQLSNVSTEALKLNNLDIEGTSTETLKMTDADITALGSAHTDTKTAAGKLAGIADTASVVPKDLTDAIANVASFKAGFEKVKGFLGSKEVEGIEKALEKFDAPGGQTLVNAKAIGAALTTDTSTFKKDSTYTKDTSDASTAIASIDAALESIASNRATLGATLNRLDFNVNNLKSQSSSMASAASQIEDADMAKEMSEMTKFKILNEAGISMLSQANQTPQMVSKLLQ
ncbi:flagellin N-terminal helical domain-containing protein [Bacillus wiedmannii]|uniref:flagellin N-terminal helical domain-containing protein n=1 Tax=Bacillus wiedmannii TaxID=1890302 RepID=UPI000BF26A64|nr:flagellin [Bacillus wiedmannii]MED3314918.1 flagellin [Bacillus wiedmannii]MEE3948217.1 flagellin [Bacillus wiedmannii]PFZ98278.1 flagellin [Bacillus wiedmannii]PGB69674.1 flagellin [Bacillus wiedmannii]PGD58310.1 flagellin [Bacillus wiedmannii]